MKKSGVMVPPEQKHRGEYWPVGPGKNHLNKRNPAAPAPSSAVTPGPAANTGATQQKRDLNMSESEKDVQMRNVAASVGFVKRADAPVVKICEPKDNNKDGEGCYPYAHSIPDMFESYKDIVW